MRNLIAQNTPQHKNGYVDTGFPEQDSFFKDCHTDIVDTQGLHPLCNANQAVPVGVGFQDGHDFSRCNKGPDRL